MRSLNVYGNDVFVVVVVYLLASFTCKLQNKVSIIVLSVLSSIPNRSL